MDMRIENTYEPRSSTYGEGDERREKKKIAES